MPTSTLEDSLSCFGVVDHAFDVWAGPFGSQNCSLRLQFQNGSSQVFHGEGKTATAARTEAVATAAQGLQKKFMNTLGKSTSTENELYREVPSIFPTIADRNVQINKVNTNYISFRQSRNSHQLHDGYVEEVVLCGKAGNSSKIFSQEAPSGSAQHHHSDYFSGDRRDSISLHSGSNSEEILAKGGEQSSFCRKRSLRKKIHNEQNSTKSNTRRLSRRIDVRAEETIDRIEGETVEMPPHHTDRDSRRSRQHQPRRSYGNNGGNYGDQRPGWSNRSMEGSHHPSESMVNSKGRTGFPMQPQQLQNMTSFPAQNLSFQHPFNFSGQQNHPDGGYEYSSVPMNHPNMYMMQSTDNGYPVSYPPGYGQPFFPYQQTPMLGVEPRFPQQQPTWLKASFVQPGNQSMNERNSDIGTNSAGKDNCPLNGKHSLTKRNQRGTKQNGLIVNRDHQYDKSSKYILVDSLSSSEEDDGEDYISKLHSLTHKKKCTGAIWNFDRCRKKKTNDEGWMCTGSVKTLPLGPSSERLVRSCVAYNKQRAKKKAAKALYFALHSVIARRCTVPESSEQLPNSPSPQKKSKVKNVAQVSAITALFQLRQAGALEFLDFDYGPSVEAARDKWQCTVIMGLPGDRVVRVSYTACQKRIAKQIAAQKGFEKLQELQIPQTDDYAIKAVECPDEMKEIDIPSLPEEVTKDIVQVSDDESGVVDDTSPNKANKYIQLPRDYKLSIPKTGQECDAWFHNHLSPASHVGIYIDSLTARTALPESCEGEFARPGNFTDKFPFICISTGTHGLVLRRVTGPSTSTDEPMIEGTSFWIPSLAREVLRDPLIRKHGYRIDEGVVSLRTWNGVEVESINEIASTFTAVNGVGSKRTLEVSQNLEDLTYQLLEKKILRVNAQNIWTDINDGLENDIGNDVAIGVLSSYACLAIREQIALRGKRKKAQVYGTAAEFEDLANRLLQPT